MTKVYTLEGNIINLGDWDYLLVLDDSGVDIVTNPLPEDAIEEDIEIYFADDGVIRKESERAAYELSLQVEAAKKELSPLMTDIRLDMATDEEIARAKELRQFIKDNEVV